MINEPPGQRLDIAGIPAAVTAQHNEVLYYWVDSGFQRATLFHIDAHSDLSSWAHYKGVLRLDSYAGFAIDNFIAPAVYHGIVTSIYWLNPQSSSRRLQYFGSSLPAGDGLGLEVKISPGGRYIWENNDLGFDMISQGRGKIVSPGQMQLSYPLILDVDLDAFCCAKDAHGVAPETDTVQGYEQRIEETADVLRELGQRPDLITITRSEAGGKLQAYVPEELVDEIQDLLISRLRELYWC